MFGFFPEVPVTKIRVSAPVRQEKGAQRSTFWVRRPPGGAGVFHAKGWWPKGSRSPSKVCLPWVSERGIWDVPGILPGYPGPLGVFEKFMQKMFVCIFRSLTSSVLKPYCQHVLTGASAERSRSERIFFLRHKPSHEKCSEIIPEYFEPLFCGSKKSRKIPAKFPAKLPSQD